MWRQFIDLFMHLEKVCSKEQVCENDYLSTPPYHFSKFFPDEMMLS